ncbi:M23 family metallopeptidase [Orenia marismortui]|uniref:M23 family metallopeptidase n=1 Tax=Orenia marismortui TaxID=46469 RepID=UPI0003801B03|nr:M23 family metallopeptidase [Orenia marismortui]
MAKKSDKWPFSILLDRKKLKLKDSIKSWKWMGYYILVVVVFMIVGGSIAFYQYKNNINLEEPHFQRTNINNTQESVKLIEDIKEANDNYKLNTTKISLPQQKEDVEDTPAVKVSAKPAQSKSFSNLYRPVDGNIILSWHSPYKDKVLDAWKFNSGIDISAEIGTKVKAAAEGIVKEIIKDDYQGVTIIIEHSTNLQTLYSNLETNHVVEGEKVHKGQVVGEIGDSGLNDKSKLHFEVIKVDGEKQKRVSPLDYIN